MRCNFYDWIKICEKAYTSASPKTTKLLKQYLLTITESLSIKTEKQIERNKNLFSAHKKQADG